MGRQAADGHPDRPRRRGRGPGRARGGGPGRATVRLVPAAPRTCQPPLRTSTPVSSSRHSRHRSSRQGSPARPRPSMAEVAGHRLPGPVVSGGARPCSYYTSRVFRRGFCKPKLQERQRLKPSKPSGGTMPTINWPWAVILCRFSDIASEPQPPQYYSDLYTANGTGGIADYWRAVTCNALDLTGSRVFGWFTMNHPSS